MKTTTLSAVTLGSVLLLASCATTARNQQPADSDGPSSSITANATSGSGSAATAAQQLLARHGLAGADVRTVIGKLEATQEDRKNGLVGSIRATEVQLSDAQGRAALPIPQGQFYLSMAPYLKRTHDCFNHNLATCQGELTNAPVKVTVTGADGKTLVSQEVTTWSNGFAGIWLPSNIKGNLTITHQGKKATTPISTGPQDPTCLTTLRLA